MKKFGGKILFLDRDDINTDEIIPAKYLTEITKEALKPYALEDLEIPGFDSRRDIKDIGVIIARSNFGCGSSREHAPWALEVNGINAVAASGFARIFRQNMFNCGMLAAEIAPEEINALFRKHSGAGPAQASFDMDSLTMTVTSEAGTDTLKFSVSEYDLELVKAGGWVEYADRRY